MSTAQIVFTTDATLKKQTLQKLKKEWSTLKSLLQYTMKAYLQWRISLGIIPEDDMWTAELEADYQAASKDFAQGKNIVERDSLVKKYT